MPQAMHLSMKPVSIGRKTIIINIILGLSSSQTINTLTLLVHYTVVKSITLYLLMDPNIVSLV